MLNYKLRVKEVYNTSNQKTGVNGVIMEFIMKCIINVGIQNACFYALNYCFRSSSEICGELSVKHKLSVNIEQVATLEILSIMQGFLHSVGVLISTSLAAILYS